MKVKLVASAITGVLFGSMGFFALLFLNAEHPFKLVADMEQHWEDMAAVSKALKAGRTIF